MKGGSMIDSDCCSCYIERATIEYIRTLNGYGYIAIYSDGHTEKGLEDTFRQALIKVIEKTNTSIV